MFRYRAKASCVAILTEWWTVTSDRPLTDEEVAVVLLDGAEELEVPAEVTVACVDEEADEETNRQVLSVTELT